MDPLTVSALIGAGGSLLGGMMNTSSAQAINQQQLQFAQEQATGAFLPQLIANAQRAGVNPLAVIGSGSGGGLRLTTPEPGAGVTGAAQALARAVHDPAADRRAALDEEISKQRLYGLQLQNEGTVIDNQRAFNQLHMPEGQKTVKGGPLAHAAGYELPFPYNVMDASLALGKVGLSRVRDLEDTSGVGSWLNTADDWINKNIYGK
jgi:hypothetical protein